ncbi:MAG: hypothetical protein QM635_03995 [Microbacteriaceae bacterium]
MVGWLIAGIAVTIVLVSALLDRLGVIDLSDKTRRAGSYRGTLGAIDEVFSPNKHEIQLAQDRETMLPAPAPVAPDGGRPCGGGVYGGRVRIEL